MLPRELYNNDHLLSQMRSHQRYCVPVRVRREIPDPVSKIKKKRRISSCILPFDFDMKPFQNFY